MKLILLIITLMFNEVSSDEFLIEENCRQCPDPTNLIGYQRAMAEMCNELCQVITPEEVDMLTDFYR